MLTVSEIYDMAEKYGAKAAAALDKYQETGNSRYDRQKREAEDMEEALRLAAGAAGEHQSLVHLRGELAYLANLAKRCEAEPGMADALRDAVLSTAILHGIIEEDEP